MIGYLENLALRSTSRGPLLRPRIHSVFEPQPQNVSLSLMSSGINNVESGTASPQDGSVASPAGIRLTLKNDSGIGGFSPHSEEESESSFMVKTKSVVDASHYNRVVNRETPDVPSQDSRLHQKHREHESEKSNCKSTGTVSGDDSDSIPLQSVPDAISRSMTTRVPKEMDKLTPRLGSPLTPQYREKEEHAERKRNANTAVPAVLRPSSVCLPNSKNQVPVVSKKESGEPYSGPIVHVTIGRVEIKAITSHRQPTPVQRSGNGPVSLEEYLRKRSRENN